MTAFNQHSIAALKFDAVEALPIFKEVRGKDWVYWGEKNDYPDYLIGLMHKSPRHNALIRGAVNYIKGKGLKVNTSGLDTLRAAKLKDFVDNPNRQDTWNDLSEKLITDYKIFGGYCFQVIWNKKGDEPAEIWHVDMANIRTNADSSKYYFTKNWKSRKPMENDDWKEFEPFNPDKPKGNQLYYYKDHTPQISGMPNVYPLPDYIGAIPYIEADFEVANFDLARLKNGFWGGTLISFNNGQPETEEQKKEIEKKVYGKAGGTDNANRFLISFSDNKETAPEILPIQPADMDGQVVELSKRLEQAILTGHQVTSGMLFGIKTEGQLGGRSEIREAYELYQNVYVTGKQNTLERSINEIASLKGFSKRITIVQTEPVGIEFSEQVIAQNMSQDEIREKLGLPALVQTSTATDNINTLSPLVANKVLNSMTENEIRALAGLPPLEGGDVVKTVGGVTMKQDFAAHEFEAQVLTALKSMGEPCSNFEIIESTKIGCMKFQATDDELKVLGLIKKDPQLPNRRIAEALNISIARVNDLIKSLEGKNLIKTTTEKTKGAEIITRNVTKPGNNDLKVDNPVSGLEIKYRYVKSPEVEGDAVLPTTRDFCRELIEADKLYTRAEIDRINNDFDLDVFLYRGGWWRREGTDITTPSCRHEWRQLLVKRK